MTELKDVSATKKSHVGHSWRIDAGCELYPWKSDITYIECRWCYFRFEAKEIGNIAIPENCEEEL